MMLYHRQWLTALTLNLGAITIGLTGGWASPYIAKLTAPDCTHRLKLTSSDASWVVSLTFIGKLTGGILAAAIQGVIGRKRTLLCMCGPLALGWTLTIVAPTVSWLYASRILIGIPVGILFTASASFLGEIADPMIRGSLITLVPTGITCGGLLGITMGGFLPMETFAYVCLVLTGLFFVVFVLIPESPYYYIANGNLRKAEKSLQWYKPDVDVKRETDELQDMIGNKGFNVPKIFNEFRKQENRKNFLLIFILTAFPYCAGGNVIHAYAEIILTKSKINLTPSVVVMALNFSAAIAHVVPMVLVDKFGRRALLMGSGFFLSIGYILLGSHFHMLSLGVDPKSINWLSVFSFFVVYVSLPCGLSTVRESLVGELFPPILKTPGSLIFTASGAFTAFGSAKCFQPYVDLVGEKYVFWTFATVALCSVVFSYFCIPETTRMKLKDIQENLKKNVKENKESTANNLLGSEEETKMLPRSET